MARRSQKGHCRFRLVERSGQSGDEGEGGGCLGALDEILGLDRRRFACPSSSRCDGPHVEACGSNAVEGYTDAYVPVTGTPLTESYDTNLIDGEDTVYVGTQTSMDCSLYLGENCPRL